MSNLKLFFASLYVRLLFALLIATIGCLMTNYSVRSDFFLGALHAQFSAFFVLLFSPHVYAKGASGSPEFRYVLVASTIGIGFPFVRLFEVVLDYYAISNPFLANSVHSSRTAPLFLCAFELTLFVIVRNRFHIRSD